MQAISQCWQRREEVESTSHVPHVSPLAVLRNDRNTLWWEPHPGTSGQGELSGHEEGKFRGCSWRRENPFLCDLSVFNLLALEVNRLCKGNLVSCQICSLCVHTPSAFPLPAFSRASMVEVRFWWAGGDVPKRILDSNLEILQIRRIMAFKLSFDPEDRKF